VQAVVKLSPVVSRIITLIMLHCLNRWQTHGGRSIGQAIPFARGVVVALVSHQRDRNDKLRVRVTASAMDLQYVLQYTYTYLHNQ